MNEDGRIHTHDIEAAVAALRSGRCAVANAGWGDAEACRIADALVAGGGGSNGETEFWNGHGHTGCAARGDCGAPGRRERLGLADTVTVTHVPCVSWSGESPTAPTWLPLPLR